MALRLSKMAFSAELLTASSGHNHTSFPFISIVVIVAIYVVISYLIIDFVTPEEDSDSQDPSPKHELPGLSLEELEDLPRFGYRGGEASKSCAICLDAFKRRHVCRIFPVCQHIFHARCVDPWLLRSRSCPICRAPLRCRAGLDV